MRREAEKARLTEKDQRIAERHLDIIAEEVGRVRRWWPMSVGIDEAESAAGLALAEIAIGRGDWDDTSFRRLACVAVRRRIRTEIKRLLSPMRDSRRVFGECISECGEHFTSDYANRPSPGPAAEASYRDSVRFAMSRLGPENRELFVDVFLAGRTAVEVATLNRMNPNTILGRMARLKRTIRSNPRVVRAIV